MTIFKKLTAILLSTVMLVCLMCVPASANIRSEAKKYNSLSMLSLKNNAKASKMFYYKMTFGDKGIVSFEAGKHKTGEKTRYVIYDSAGKVLVSGVFSDLLGKQINLNKKGTYYFSLRLLKGEYINDLYYMYSAKNGKKLKKDVTIILGNTYSFSSYTKGFSGNVKWKSNDKTIAKVSGENIIALAEGKTEIYAFSSGGDYAAINLTVKKKGSVSSSTTGAAAADWNKSGELTASDISVLKKEFATFPCRNDKKYFTSGGISEATAIDWLFDLDEKIIDPQSASGYFAGAQAVQEIGSYGFMVDMIKVPEKVVDDLIYRMFGKTATHTATSELWYYKDGYYYFQSSGNSTYSTIEYDSYEKLSDGRFIAKFVFNKLSGYSSSSGTYEKQDIYALVSVYTFDGKNYVRIHSVAKTRDGAR